MQLPDPASLPRPWLAAYPPGVPPTYAYPDVPLTRFLDDAARDFPDLTATWFQGATLTYADLLDAVDRFASALAALGVGRGDRVAVILPNVPAAPIAVFAVHRLGAVLVPVPSRADDAELRAQLLTTGSEVAVALTPVAARLASLGLPELRHVIATDLEEWLTFPRQRLHRVRRRIRPVGGDLLRFRELIDRSDAIAKQEPVAGDDPAVIQHAGAGATSRAVVLSHANLTANAFQARLWIPDTQAGRERVLCALPLTSVHGLTTCLLSGVLSAASLVLVPGSDAGRTIRIAEETRPTLFPATAGIYRSLVEHPAMAKADLRSLRACTAGGGTVPDEIAMRFEERTGARLREGYGIVEASPITHANPIYGRSVAGSIGLPVTDTVAAVVDRDGTPLPPGHLGTLIVHGPQVARRYWGPAPEGLRGLVDGWLVTGDSAMADEDGYFTFVGKARP